MDVLPAGTHVMIDAEHDAVKLEDGHWIMQDGGETFVVWID